MKRLLLPLSLLLATACSGGDDVEADAPQIITERLADVRLDASYDKKIEATGGTPPYTFSLASGALPTGISLEAATGQLKGLAAVPGRAEFTAAVTDDKGKQGTKALSIYVIPDSLEVVTTLLPSGKEGDAYDQTLIARGGVPPMTWTVDAGALPDGLTLAEDGRLTGVPTTFGGFDFTVKVADSEAAERLQDLMLFVVSLDPVIKTSTIPKGRQGEAYSTTLVAEGGVPAYSWDLTAGDLPTGLTLANDGSLTGTPEDSGDFPFTVTVQDSQLRTDESAVNLRIIAPLRIETPAIPQVILGRGIDHQMVASGGEPPYTWRLTGSLPSGVSFEESTGRIVGDSTQLGEFPVTIRVTDSEGFRDSALFEIRVTDRFTYDVEPMAAFPATCTATTVSYVNIPIEVTDSMQIEDLDVFVDLDYEFNQGGSAPNDELKVVLFHPDGERQAPLCGDGADVPGGEDCGGQGGITRLYDDEGPGQTQPDRPLAAFDGMNPVGTWRLRVAVSNPNCNRGGTINNVVISIRDDRTTDPYVVVGGFTHNNLLLAPWVRLTGNNDQGIDEHEIFLTATIYAVGPNGFREGGAGDDVPEQVALTWQWGGTPIPEVTLTPDGHVTAGSLTGESMVTASGGGHVINVPLYVVPPDWNPMVRIP